MPTFRSVLLGATFTSLVGGGVALSRKQSLISVRRNELLEEKEKLQSDLRQQLALVTESGTKVKEAVDREEKRRDGFQTLWADRISRYDLANVEAASFLDALPEALGATKGLLHHYRYAAEQLRHFVGFDVASSKVHNLALISAGLGNDPHQRASALKGLFASEPLIGEITTTLETLSTGSNTSNIEDLARTFEYCVGSLEERMDRVSKVVADESLQTHRPDSMALAATEKALEVLKLSLLDSHQSTVDTKRSQSRNLCTVSDIASALDYIDDVLARLTTKSDKQLVEAVRTHPLVTDAARQLEAWQAGAAVFLVEQQAARALGAYQSLLSLSLAQSHE